MQPWKARCCFHLRTEVNDMTGFSEPDSWRSWNLIFFIIIYSLLVLPLSHAVSSENGSLQWWQTKYNNYWKSGGKKRLIFLILLLPLKPGTSPSELHMSCSHAAPPSPSGLSSSSIQREDTCLYLIQISPHSHNSHYSWLMKFTLGILPPSASPWLLCSPVLP